MLAALLLAVVPAVSPQGFDSLLQIAPARSRRTSSSSPDDDSNRDNLHVDPGGTYTLCELNGPGVIRHLWLTFPEARPSWLAEHGGARPDEIVLRMYWDGQEQPAVEAPVGDFFAVGFGERREVRSAIVAVDDGDSYNCWWPMPFFEHAKITLTNESEKPLNSTYYHIDWEERALPEKTPYFCAQYRQEFPCEHGHDYLILDAVGTGHYVGTVLSVRTRSPEWFGEGDDRFTIDGEKVASIRGTGTEDYFLSAWGLKKSSMPYSGTTLLEGGWGHLGQRTTAYRWHLLDPVHFATSLRVTIEHKGWVPGDEKPDGKENGHTERFDDFASVAFWYQLGAPKRFATLPPAKERVPPSLDVIVEGRTLLDHATADGGNASLQAGYGWTGAGQVFFRAEHEGATLELPFTVGEVGRRALILPLTRSYDYGIWSIALDGETVASDVDLWSEDTRVEEIMLGTHDWQPGQQHVLRFQCTGRDPRSRGCFLGVDSVRLRERLPAR